MSPRKQTASTRKRRQQPINRYVAKNGRVSYRFQIDVGLKPDGSRDRQQFTFPSKKQAIREYRRISAEVAEGRYQRQTTATVSEACDMWLSTRRKIRPVTVESYRQNLKPVRRFFGSKQLRLLTVADGDRLVEWMLASGRRSPRHYRSGSLASRVLAVIDSHSDGVSVGTLRAAFPDDDVYTCLSGLARSGRVTRPRRGVYVSAEPPGTLGGVKPVTVRTTLKTFQMVVQTFVVQGSLPRNVIALVDRPSDYGRYHDHAVTDDEIAGHSWSAGDVQVFLDSVREHRFYACWMLSRYGLRRSEVLGLRWSDLDLDTRIVHVRRARVVVARQSKLGPPKSHRGWRDLPMPRVLADALAAFKTMQIAETTARGDTWSDHQFVAGDADGNPISPDWYSHEFARLRDEAGLPEVPLKVLRNTNVTLMLASGASPHVVAAWHGHSPEMSLSTYLDIDVEDLRTAISLLDSQ